MSRATSAARRLIADDYDGRDPLGNDLEGRTLRAGIELRRALLAIVGRAVTNPSLSNLQRLAVIADVTTREHFTDHTVAMRRLMTASDIMARENTIVGALYAEAADAFQDAAHRIAGRVADDEPT